MKENKVQQVEDQAKEDVFTEAMTQNFKMFRVLEARAEARAKEASQWSTYQIPIGWGEQELIEGLTDKEDRRKTIDGLRDLYQCQQRLITHQAVMHGFHAAATMAMAAKGTGILTIEELLPIMAAMVEPLIGLEDANPATGRCVLSVTE